MFSFFARKKIDPKEKLKQALEGYDLPSFPGAVIETLQRLRNPNSSAASIAEVVSVDPGLSVRILRIANSAAFSPGRKVENLPQAIALLGFSQVESLVLPIAVSNTAPKTAVPGYDFRTFWHLCAIRGILARELASILCPAQVPVSFTAGFLQDMAVPFLAHERTKEYVPLLTRWQQGEGELNQLEREVFDWDHAEVATWICNEWDLPEPIASAIGGHHGNDSDIFNCPVPVSLVAPIASLETDAIKNTLVQPLSEKHDLPQERVETIIDASLKHAEELVHMIA